MLSNAIKFSKPHDRIDIDVTTSSRGKNSTETDLKIKVIDSGIGITQQDIKNLFKPFFKTTDVINQERNKNSHGLGLNICKRIITGMGGALDVTSETGVGTTFTITLKTEFYDRKAEMKKVSVLESYLLGYKIKEIFG